MNPLVGYIVEEAILTDESPSDAVESARFDPMLGIIEITFHKGGQTYAYPCSAVQFEQYVGSDSKGSALSSIFGVHGGRR